MSKSWLIILLLILSFDLRSQPCDIFIKDRADSISFLEFIDKTEKAYHLQFFVKEEWIDSLKISVNKVPVSLKDLLEENFKDTGLSFYFYSCNKIIITRDYVYIKDIPESFFPGVMEPNSDRTIRYDESSFFRIEYLDTYYNQSDRISIGDPSQKYQGSKASVNGYIMDTINDIPLVGAVIYFDDLESATVTDIKGFYTIRIEKGIHTMHIKSVGKKEKSLEVEIFSDGTLNETLEDEAVSLDEVFIYADKEHNVRGLQLGFEKLDMNTIRQIPNPVGETDILKMALLLPGVQTVGEGSSGFNVRGGSADQNLLLIDNAPIYNSSHLFGFFSAINAEMVNDFRLYKSSYPAYYGGRLSSVFDVNLKKGSNEKFSVQGGISPITGKLLAEGPIVKDKASFIISGRSTYSDWILDRINSPVIQNSKASFYDLNGKINAELNKNNELQLSMYTSSDNFRLNSDTNYAYHNLNGSLLWKHRFGDRLTVNTTGVFSEYEYDVNYTRDSVYAFSLSYKIRHYEGKIDFLFLLNAHHKLRFGLNSIFYQLDPGKLEPASPSSNIAPLYLDTEQGVESALFINDEYSINERLMLNLGLRYSLFYSLGPSKVYTYSDDAPRNTESRIDSTFYGKNQISGRYGFPEFRISARYQLSSANSIKASFSAMTQYIHMLTNTMSVSPTDTWTLSNPNLPPQRSQQYSLGYYHNFYHNMYEASIELYYKKLDNMLEFKPGAQLLVNPDLELELISGEGRAYGIEMLLKKKQGRLNGWVSYTYARSLIRVESEFAEERINQGEFYPTTFDKPHDFTLVSNYRISRRVSLSATITYNTGHPVSYPVAWYRYRGRELLHYSKRNEYRIPDYFRIDFSVNVEGNLKLKKLAHSSWTFSVYNLTGRDNVYSVYFVSDPYRNVMGYKLSIFSQPIPSITYNFRF
jgi:hypothetical protein